MNLDRRFTSIEFAFRQKNDTVNSKAETLTKFELMPSGIISSVLV